MTRLAIVPAYNERESIDTVVRELRAHAPSYDVLVVDDGSTDGTADVAVGSGARVIQLPFNLGIGGAMQTGYRFAATHGYQLAVQVDGDGQHDPRSICLLESYLDEHPEIGMVSGSRFVERNSDGFRSSPTRRVGIRMFAALLSRIVGSKITDPTSGLRMVRRPGIEIFARDYPHDYPEVEALVLMHTHRLRAAEVPVVMRPRLGGRSSITASQSVYYMLKVTLAVGIAILRRKPIVEPGDSAPVSAEGQL